MTQFYQCLIFYIKSKKFITAEYPPGEFPQDIHPVGYSSSRIFIHPTMFLHCSLVICSWTSCSTMLLSAPQCINLVGSPSGEPMFSLCRKWRKICRTLQSHMILVWTIRSRTASCFKPQVAIFQLRSSYKLHKGYT